MRVRTALLVGAVLLAGLGLAGAATATPTDGSEHETNETTNASGSAGTEVGICVTGVDSPCNGEQWDGDEESTNDGRRDSAGGTDRGTAIGDANSSTSAEVGICVTGVDSPCNGQQWDGDGDRSTARTHEAVVSEGSASEESGFDVGALVRLLGSVAFGLTPG